MEKIKLEINRKQQNGHFGTLGMPFLLDVLKNSDLYEISLHEYFLKTARDMRATTLFANGKKIYLDLWEYPTPCYTKNAYDAEFDLIIKVQDMDMGTKRAHRYLNRKKMLPFSMEEIQAYRDKIEPWTFFPSRLFTKYVGKEDELNESPPEVDRLGFFCGKAWKCRNKIMASLSEKGLDVRKSNQGVKGGRKLTDEDFIDYMKKSKYGIVLAGRSTAVTDCKNRREMDYMMLRKPLLLNYHPYYYNKLVEGVHFIKIDENTDLNDLENQYNIEEIGENGYQWYLENVRPDGAANVFRQILKDKLNI
jgi:hypothetical protein